MNCSFLSLSVCVSVSVSVVFVVLIMHFLAVQSLFELRKWKGQTAIRAIFGDSFCVGGCGWR